MKYYKTVNGFIKHLKSVSDQPPVRDMKGASKYSEEQLASLVAIKATIDNELGENFNQ